MKLDYPSKNKKICIESSNKDAIENINNLNDYIFKLCMSIFDQLKDQFFKEFELYIEKIINSKLIPILESFEKCNYKVQELEDKINSFSFEVSSQELNNQNNIIKKYPLTKELRIQNILNYLNHLNSCTIQDIYNLFLNRYPNITTPSISTINRDFHEIATMKDNNNNLIYSITKKYPHKKTRNPLILTKNYDSI